MKSELLKLAKENKNVVFLVSDDGKDLLSDVKHFFQDRVVEFGLKERAMVSSAAGFCLKGKLPVLVGEDLFVKCMEGFKANVIEPQLNVRVMDFGENKGVDFSALSVVVLEDYLSFEKSFKDYGLVMLKLSV